MRSYPMHPSLSTSTVHSERHADIKAAPHYPSAAPPVEASCETSHQLGQVVRYDERVDAFLSRGVVQHLLPRLAEQDMNLIAWT